jgi:hypothetical protein
VPEETEIAELEQIRRDLRTKREYVDDGELRAEIHAWLDESHERTDADTVAEFVSSRLTGMLAEHDMFHSSTVDSPGEAFPDACADCRHYGSACPVLVGPVEPEWRDRKLAEAESEADQRQIFQQQAVDTGCIRIPEFLDEWDEEHAEFVHRGETLLHKAEENYLDPDELDDTDVDVDIGGGAQA